MRQRAVGNLAAAGQIVLRQQLLLELIEYVVADTMLGQSITEQPDRLGIRDAAALGQIKQTQEAATIQ